MCCTVLSSQYPPLYHGAELFPLKFNPLPSPGVWLISHFLRGTCWINSLVLSSYWKYIKVSQNKRLTSNIGVKMDNQKQSADNHELSTVRGHVAICLPNQRETGDCPVLFKRRQEEETRERWRFTMLISTPAIVIQSNNFLSSPSDWGLG